MVFTYLIAYVFIKRYFDRRVALLALLFMSLTGPWYNYTVRALYNSWASLPGVCLLVFWMALKYLPLGSRKYMVYGGLMTGIAFYYTPWPLVALAVPSTLLLIFLYPSRHLLEKRFVDCILFLLVLGGVILFKEILFIQMGWRYPVDASGIKVFYQTFYHGAYQGRGNADSFSLQITLPGILKFFETRIQSMIGMIFKGGLGIPPIVTWTALPGLIWMLASKKQSAKFIALICLLMLALPFVLIKSVAERYLTPIWPLFMLGSAFLIVNLYDIFARKRWAGYVIILMTSIGVLHNAYVTRQSYMYQWLPVYSTFESNCYNSIEWPFPALKQFLKDRKTVYDVIVKPNNINHNQMDSYFRWSPHLVHLEGESYGKQVVNYSRFRDRLSMGNYNRGTPGRILIIANNYNSLIKDNRHCGLYGGRFPYDPKAITMQEVTSLFPGAKFVQYAGDKNYPELLALFELDSGSLAPPKTTSPQKLTTNF